MGEGGVCFPSEESHEKVTSNANDSIFVWIWHKKVEVNCMKLILSFPVLALSFAALAADPDISKLPPPSDKKGVTYDKDIKPLVEKSCLQCHTGEKPKAKYRMDNRETFIKGGSSGDPAVVAGKSEKSFVVIYSADLVEDMEMPPKDKREKYPAWTKEQIGLVRAWIDQGAK